jgi:phosphoenolpyruvate carboxykinase (diphosphate)
MNDPVGLTPPDPRALHRHLNLKLAELGLPPVPLAGETAGLDDSLAHFIAHNREKDRLLARYACPVDKRINDFLHDYLCDAVVPPELPRITLTLDRYGLARALSLPPDRDEVVTPMLRSYRLHNGILHNPKSDRRTTAGIFHVTEGGLPIPDDKKAVPKEVFAAMFRRALQPPAELLQLPFTASLPKPAECFVSLLLRPTVCPEVPGVQARQRIEVRFFVPGSLVANLDFVESIFGNGGDPFLPENDAALDPEHWSGHTGCVVLAPHLNGLTKKELGLPHWDKASPRQQRDGMCWRDDRELYNDGQPFKLTARDASGVIVTLISDNYFGYCKKEVKTQLSFAANLFGMVEEEHAGGALVFARHDLGSDYDAAQHRADFPQTFAEVTRLFADRADFQPEGCARDRQFPEVLYVPENTRFDLETQSVTWDQAGRPQRLKLLADHVYMLPSGFQVHLEPPVAGRAWRLVGTRPEGTLCHKPCTVSGGGKSEISKPLSDAIIHGSVYVSDLARDLAEVETVIGHDFSRRFRNAALHGSDRRPVLSPLRTLGSVIKLFTPSADFSDEYNRWLETIPAHVQELVLVLKRFWRPGWGDDWRGRFSVDVINGRPANELRLGHRRLMTQFLRVGYDADGAWRTFSLRKDFLPAAKLQMEDDITASVLVPRSRLAGLDPQAVQPGVKFVTNVESRLFQRPDDAIHRGYDRAAEGDFAQRHNFFSNYEPLDPRAVRDLMEDAVGLHQFTEPLRRLIESVHAAPAGSGPQYLVTTAHPRIVDGKPTKNPRYLQTRPDLVAPRRRYLAELGARFARRLPSDQPLHTPVHAVLAGRRNNAAEPGVRSLACYGPVHQMDLPEALMEFISSMTGKSPSTTGAGSEGALTKGPFNALPPIFDLNAAFVSYALSQYPVFLTSAGCLGPRTRVDHDVSLLVPEVWCRLGVSERDPKFLHEHGYLERLTDRTMAGRKIAASRLGSRITPKFVSVFFGRIFTHPHAVLTEAMLRPELQDEAEFADAVDNVLATHQRVAGHYFSDDSVRWAVPPLRALLHIMRDGQFEGRTLEDPELRSQFTRESVLASGWYRERLLARQKIEMAHWNRSAAYLERFIGRPGYEDEIARLGLFERRALVRSRYEHCRQPEYVAELEGTIGAEPSVLRPT